MMKTCDGCFLFDSGLCDPAAQIFVSWHSHPSGITGEGFTILGGGNPVASWSGHGLLPVESSVGAELGQQSTANSASRPQ